MGCCLSTKQPTKANDKRCRRAPPMPPPPPPPQEEEAVKEVVLSETPILMMPTLIEDRVSDHKKPPENQELKVECVAEITPKETAAATKPAEDFISEVSEPSELCSFTESFSTTTTATATALEKRDDSEEVSQRSPLKPRLKRPSNGDIVGARERNAMSPARRPVPSPDKRKPVQGRTMTGQKRNSGPTNGPRRDGGDVSARRSRSPVTRGNARYRSPGLNERGGPGGRSPARAVEKGGRRNEVKNDGVSPESTEVEKQNDNVSKEVSESLENPLVSMECFIFL